MISEKQHKQFIITSHSYAIIDCVPKESRLFVETANGNSLCLCQLSTYETLTRMDSKAFPVVTFYVEDELSMKIVGKAINELNVVNAGFARMSKVVVAGSASKTYAYFKMRKKLLSEETIMPKAACVLDGDMRNKKDSNGDLLYPLEDGLFFHHSEYAPEKMLLMCYLANHPSAQLSYHAEHSNPHCLLEKMVEQGLAQDKDDAFEKCFNYYKNSVDGSVHFEELKKFIEDNCRN